MFLVLDDSGNVERRLLSGPAVDQVLAEETAADGVLWAVVDQLGTTRGWLSFDGTNTAMEFWSSFDSFGNLVDVQSAVASAALPVLTGYTGRWTDGLTGLQNNRARWYDAAAGRWSAENPIGFAAGDTNLSRYVGNNALSATDPSGLLVFLLVPAGLTAAEAAGAAIAAGGIAYFGSELIDDLFNKPFAPRCHAIHQSLSNRQLQSIYDHHLTFPQSHALGHSTLHPSPFHHTPNRHGSLRIRLGLHDFHILLTDLKIYSRRQLLHQS